MSDELLARRYREIRSRIFRLTIAGTLTNEVLKKECLSFLNEVAAQTKRDIDEWLAEDTAGATSE